MRLTDPPKRLGEVRPDVAWPTALQTAMDKALARAAAARYEHAVEFGRDLSDAAKGMANEISPAPPRVARGNTVPETRVRTPKAKKWPAAVMIGAGIAGLLVVSAALAPILWKERRPQTSAPSAVPAAPLDVDKELTEAESEARGTDKGAARHALERLSALDGHLDAAGDAARAGLVRYEAYLLLEDTKKACAALNDVKDRARGTSFQRKVDDRLAACP